VAVGDQGAGVGIDQVASAEWLPGQLSIDEQCASLKPVLLQGNRLPKSTSYFLEVNKRPHLIYL
jgi:hypothetical protein